jgi:UDP-N-acetylmuramyl pentapeptide synthase
MCVCPVTSVGTDLHADISALDIEETDDGIRFRCAETSFEIPIRGTHLVTSMLLGIAVARYLGIPVKDIAGAAKHFHPLKQTFELKSMRGVAVLDDTYNASPTSFRSAIEWARDQKGKRKILLADGIIELGEAEAPIHRSLAALAKDVFDIVYIINPHFLPYFKEILGDRVSPSSLAVPASEGDLLVCVGRMPKSLIERLLPPEL